MNNLGRDLEEGELVAISKETLKKEFHELHKRVGYVTGGFGMHAQTNGTALSFEYACDSEKVREEGSSIDIKGTEEAQRLWGKTGPVTLYS